MIAALALVGVLLVGCNDSKNNQPKSNGLPKAGTQMAATTIAVVDIDSLQEHYKYFQDERVRLETLSKQYDAQLKGKMTAFQKAQADLQQKMQRGEIKSEDDYNKAMQRLQSLQTEGQKLETSLAQKLAAEQENFNKELRKNLNNYIKEYNKEGRFSLILTKSGDNVLYVEPTMDITAEITEGLNKSYQAKKK